MTVVEQENSSCTAQSEILKDLIHSIVSGEVAHWQTF